VLHPLFIVFFFFKSTDLSRFIYYGRRMIPDQDEKKASESGHPTMLSRNYKNSQTDA